MPGNTLIVALIPEMLGGLCKGARGIHSTSWSITSSDTVDTGTITVNLTKNDVAIGESMNINAASAVRYNDEQFLDDSDANKLFTEGDRLGVLYTSDGTLDPETLDLVVVIIVRF